MKIHRPLWNEGALLAPQQFQQQSEWDAFSRVGIAARGNAFPWGVGRVELDDAMLASGRVQAQSLRLWLPDDTLVDNHTRNIWRTAGDNKFRLEDKRQEEHFKLATPFGKTQLNGGHVVDSEREPRGTGFELRTDEYGALRAGRGMFLTADAQPSAQGKVLDMAPAIERLNQSVAEMNRLNLLAQQAKALTCDLESQNSLLENRLKDLQSAALLGTRLHVSVWGMPYSEQFCFRPGPAPRPLIAGTLTARVESDEKNALYAHLDETGRYRVKLDFSREDAEPGYNYLWIRQAKPYAGETYGWHTPLINGTEVGIAFDGGDPDRPYIAHAFHDSEHPDVVTRDNRSQNILRTAGQNELRMEDLRQSEHIALSTPFGATALNQGHIVDAGNEPRGTGFELRTDEFGVIRVAKGLLVTADGKVHGEGDVLDMDVALKEIEAVRTQIEGLATATRQAKALEADIASQQAMFATRLKTLNEMLHFSAPEGMAFTSAEHLQLAATDNIALNAGGDISIGTQGHITGLAGDSVGMFAQHGKLSLISAQGPVQFQAQHGVMHLSAEQKLTLISAREMLLTAKKRIRLVGGGSSILIEQGQIKYETAGTYTRKATGTTAEY